MMTVLIIVLIQTSFGENKSDNPALIIIVIQA